MSALGLFGSLAVCGLGLGLFLISIVYAGAVYRLARLLIERNRPIAGIIVFLAGCCAPTALWLFATRVVAR